MLEQALKEIECTSDLNELQELRVQYLGKKGLITQQLKSLGALKPEERREAGQRINRIKSSIDNALKERHDVLGREELQKQLHAESVDVTLPGTAGKQGNLHLLTLITNKLLDVFVSLGYEVAVGPEL